MTPQNPDAVLSFSIRSFVLLNSRSLPLTARWASRILFNNWLAVSSVILAEALTPATAWISCSNGSSAALRDWLPDHPEPVGSGLGAWLPALSPASPPPAPLAVVACAAVFLSISCVIAISLIVVVVTCLWTLVLTGTLIRIGRKTNLTLEPGFAASTGL